MRLTRKLLKICRPFSMSFLETNVRIVPNLFIPVGEEELSALNHVIVLVSAGLFTKAVITLQDGSQCIVKKDAVTRKITIKG
ncbi:MAG: hypothetical protein E7576_07670 [Ruminococcaceae bacterium]|nr:hypothetical protein [Oscillospiraceae bacterium]